MIMRKGQFWIQKGHFCIFCQKVGGGGGGDMGHMASGSYVPAAEEKNAFRQYLTLKWRFSND